MKFISVNKVILAAFVLWHVYYSYERQIPDCQQIADKLTEKTARQLQEQKNLSSEWPGGLFLVGKGGRRTNDIQAMHMNFGFSELVDLKAARELIVCSISEYLKNINTSKEIKPYLKEYPFTAKNVEMDIQIRKPGGSRIPLNEIHHISAIDGILTYYLDFPETCSRQNFFKETYEEALQSISSNQ